MTLFFNPKKSFCSLVSKASKEYSSKFCNKQSNISQLKKTPLHDLHSEFGAEFNVYQGNWLLPKVFIDFDVHSSNLYTRSNVSLFDLSHMLQLKLTGKNKDEFLEFLVCGDIKNLEVGEGRLTLLTKENGGILDDVLVVKQADFLHVIGNAQSADKNVKHINEHLQHGKNKGLDVFVDVLSDNSLISLQGPESMSILQNLLPQEGFNLEKMPFMTSIISDILEFQDCVITRGGYTGEDGFMITVHNSKSEEMVRKLLKFSHLKLGGMETLNSLRIESGFCMYGVDINEKITPIEATLGWTVGKRRIKDANFLGSSVIINQLNCGCSKKRIGLRFDGTTPAETGSILFDSSNKVVGAVTSSVFSPTLQQVIAMAYVEVESSKLNTKLLVERNGNERVDCIVTKMPFINPAYYKVA